VDHTPPRLDRQRLSSLAALVLLAYGLIRVVVLPAARAEFAIFGLLIRFDFNTPFFMLVLAAALAVAGADWLIRSHPYAAQSKPTVEHWVIPGLAALGAGAILARIPNGLPFAAGLSLAAALLVAVVAAEFFVLDVTDPRHDLAAIGLRALACLLLVGALFAVLATGLRAIFAVPLVMASSAAVAWRLIRLGDPANPAWQHGSIIGLIATEIAWALHYWWIEPLREALVLGLIVYLATGIVLAQRQGSLKPRRAIEYGLVGAVSLVIIFAFA
jgi:hypothetical protein